MFYKKELDFFRKSFEALKIRTAIITEKNIPDDIDMGIRRLLNLQEDYEKFINSNLNFNENAITVVSDMFMCNFIFIPLPESNPSSMLVLGPYTKELITKNSINKKTVESALPSYINIQLDKFYGVVPYFPNDDTILALVNSFGELIFKGIENFTIVHKRLEREVEIPLFPQSSQPKDTEPFMAVQLLERRYAKENELIDAVSKGLTHKAEMIFTNVTTANALESRLTDSLRNTKNYLIILNTLLRKGAEQGKVHPFHIDVVSTDFALKIEACQSVEECGELLKYMVIKYCRLVKKHSQKNYSLLIQKVITQIESDIASDLSLNNLSKIFDVNSSYLSSLFKKETGCTLTDYVNKQRIERAKDLLISTNLQIQSIAQRCGMLDVNYFTKTFKKYTDLTPKKYREKYMK